MFALKQQKLSETRQTNYSHTIYTTLAYSHENDIIIKHKLFLKINFHSHSNNTMVIAKVHLNGNDIGILLHKLL